MITDNRLYRCPITVNSNIIGRNIRSSMICFHDLQEPVYEGWVGNMQVGAVSDGFLHSVCEVPECV